MQRRSFLITTATIGMTGVMSACSDKPKPGPSPSIAPMPTPGSIPRPSPPNDSAAPSSFSDLSLWPGINGPRATITALRKQHLCGGIRIPKMQATVVSGTCPVIVDLHSPTTWTLVPDDQRHWNIVDVDLSASSTPEPKAGSTSTATTAPPSSDLDVLVGPAILDESYAYFVVGVYHNSSPTADHISGSTTCAVDVIKVSLSDHAIVTSARIIDNYVTSSLFLNNTSFAFNDEHNALLVAGSKNPRDSSAKGFGFRLSSDDLSTQFDANTILTEAYQSVDAKGETLVAKKDDGSVTIVYLRNGTVETRQDIEVELVEDNWVYYNEKTHPYKNPQATKLGTFHVLNSTTGDSILLNEHPQKIFTEYVSYPLYTSQHEIISYGMSEQPAFTVSQPGSATPILSWNSNDRAIPSAACTFSDFIYMAPPNTPDSRSVGNLQVASLSSGQDVANIPIATWDSAMGISSWGIAIDGFFFPADAWFGHPS